MDREKLSAGIAYNQIAPGEPALWAEYRQRYIALVAHRCATGFLKYGAERSFGKPAKYAYLEEAPACWVVFTMRSARKAAVEIWGAQRILGGAPPADAAVRRGGAADCQGGVRPRRRRGLACGPLCVRGDGFGCAGKGYRN